MFASMVDSLCVSEYLNRKTKEKVGNAAVPDRSPEERQDFIGREPRSSCWALGGWQLLFGSSPAELALSPPTSLDHAP